MEVVINGTPIKGSDVDVIFESNNLVRELAKDYSPRSLGEFCKKVRGEKIYHWQQGRLVLLLDELREVCNVLEIKITVKGGL